MKLSSVPQNLKNLKDLESLLTALAPWVSQVSDAINSPQITLTDNVLITTISVVFGAVGANIATYHKLGTIPKGYIIIGATAPMQVYDGTGANTSNVINLRSSGTGTARVLLF